MYKKVQVGNDQENVQLEKDSNSMWKSHVIVIFFYDRQNLVHSSENTMFSYSWLDRFFIFEQRIIFWAYSVLYYVYKKRVLGLSKDAHLLFAFRYFQTFT